MIYGKSKSLPGADGQLHVINVRVLVHLWVQREQRPGPGDVDVVPVRHLDDSETGAGGRYVDGPSAFRELRNTDNGRLVQLVYLYINIFIFFF